MEKLRRQDREQEELLLKAAAEEKGEIENQTKTIVLSDYIDSALQAPSLWDENRRKVTFQSLYKKEISRQTNILHLPEHNESAGNFSSPPKGSFMAGNIGVTDDRDVAWEDGWKTHWKEEAGGLKNLVDTDECFRIKFKILER